MKIFLKVGIVIILCGVFLQLSMVWQGERSGDVIGMTSTLQYPLMINSSACVFVGGRLEHRPETGPYKAYDLCYVNSAWKCALRSGILRVYNGHQYCYKNTSAFQELDAQMKTEKK